MIRVDWTALIKRERAASALSYGLVVGLVAVLSIGAVQSVGDSVTELFGGVATDLAGGASCAANSASNGASGTYSHGALTHRASVTVVAEAAQSGDHPDLSNESAYRLDVTIRCDNGTASASTPVSVATACNSGFLLEDGACVVDTSNTASTITGPDDVSIAVGANTGALAVTVGDAETAAGTLILTAASDNPTLVPDANITLGGTDADRTVTVTPATGQIGTATITLTVDDGSGAANATATASFVVEVTNDCTRFAAAQENTNKGTLCSDGTFYIGHHDYGDGAGQVPLFAAACDIGRTFDASANGGRGGCTGVWDLMAWNDGSTTYVDTSLPNYGNDSLAAGDYDGRDATSTLAALSQTHEAAQGCDGYSAHGHGDWYLPAAGELDILWAATHESASVSDDGTQTWFSGGQSSGTDFAQTFDSRIFSNSCPITPATDSSVDQSGFPCDVWSASELNSVSAWLRHLSDGRRFHHLKNRRFAARCVRR